MARTIYIKALHEDDGDVLGYLPAVAEPITSTTFRILTLPALEDGEVLEFTRHEHVRCRLIKLKLQGAPAEHAALRPIAVERLNV